MGMTQKSETGQVMASIRKRPNGTWRARYRDDAGKEHARHFQRKTDAQRWLDEVTASVVTGQYVDPKAGRVTLREYAEHWRSIQAHRPSTRDYVETMLRRHVYPRLGDRSLSSILPSDIQAWVTGLSLAPSTASTVHGVLYTIFKAAVLDRRIPSNPCEGTKLPRAERKPVVPLTTEQVQAVRAALPEHLQGLVTLAAGTGMRQGECFGLTVDRVNFLQRSLRVDRQLVTSKGKEPTLAPPKTDSSVRTIPLPQTVVDALAAHLAAFPAASDGLVFTHNGRPITRSAFGFVWRPAADRAGLSKGTGFHALRHYYASLLIRHGESVKTVQARLGHASAAETLDTYSHLWPDSDDRTRDAIDSVLGPVADSVRTASQ